MTTSKTREFADHIKMTAKMQEAYLLLEVSEKFRNWRRFKLDNAKRPLNLKTHQMAEKHWTPQELAETWGVSVQTIRAIFQHEEGVLKIGKDGTRNRRRYKTLRIPHSIAEKVHTRLSA